MKTSLVTLLKNQMARTITPSKAKEAAEVAVKDGERMMATGQDAAALQGRSLVHQYQKPEMKVIKVERENLRAASDTGNGWNTGGRNDDDMTDLDSDWSDVKNAVDWGDVW